MIRWAHRSGALTNAEYWCLAIERDGGAREHGEGQLKAAEATTAAAAVRSGEGTVKTVEAAAHAEPYKVAPVDPAQQPSRQAGEMREQKQHQTDSTDWKEEAALAPAAAHAESAEDAELSTREPVLQAMRLAAKNAAQQTISSAQEQNSERTGAPVKLPLPRHAAPSPVGVDATPRRPNFGKMMHEKRESISQLREKGHIVDRRAKFEDGQPARGNRSYSVKEERELMKQAALDHPKRRAFKARVPRGRPAMAGSHKGRAGAGTLPPPKAHDEL